MDVQSWNNNERSLIYSALNNSFGPLPRRGTVFFFQEICIFMSRVDIPLPLLVGREHSTLYICIKYPNAFISARSEELVGCWGRKEKSRNVMTSTKNVTNRMGEPSYINWSKNTSCGNRCFVRLNLDDFWDWRCHGFLQAEHMTMLKSCLLRWLSSSDHWGYKSWFASTTSVDDKDATHTRIFQELRKLQANRLQPTWGGCIFYVHIQFMYYDIYV